MGLVGKYVNTQTGEILEVKEANNSNGQLNGSLTVTVGLSQKTIGVSGHYHFLNGSKPNGTELSAIANHHPYPSGQLRSCRALQFN